MTKAERFDHQSLIGATFQSCDMARVEFSDIDLSDARFFDVNLRGARISRLARSERLTTYGAACLELARRIDALSATRDGDLAQAAARRGVTVQP